MSIAENGNKLGRVSSLGNSETSVMNSVARNPIYARDSDIVIEGINEALTVYKKMLYQTGVRPIEIMHKVDQIKSGINRRRAIEFIRVANSLIPQNRNGNGNGNGGGIK